MTFFDESQYPASQRIGMATEVTLITPIKLGRVTDGPFSDYRTYRQRLEEVLDDLQKRETAGKPTPISFLRQIHFARWVILDPPDNARGAGSLLFTSQFDGEMKHYFRNFALNLTEDIDRVWHNCKDYPGASDFDLLWQYVKRHQVETRAFYNAYRTLTVPEIVKLGAFKAGKDGFDHFIHEAKPNLAPPDPAAPVAGGLATQVTQLLHCAQPSRTPGRRETALRNDPHPAPSTKAASPATDDRALALNDIQANILTCPPWKRAAYFFLRIANPDAFKKSLQLIIEQGKGLGLVTADHVDHAKRLESEHLQRAFNIGFTWNGLARLGLADEHLASLPLAFREGMAARAALLGDVGESAPERWDGALGSKEVHAVIGAFTIDDRATAAEKYMEEIADIARKADRRYEPGDFEGGKVVHVEVGRRIEKNQQAVEPFGFRHGISQPVIEGRGAASDGGAVPVGEFIMGYGDADGNDQIEPPLVTDAVRKLCLDGSFMVFRKLEQDVAAFNEFTGTRPGLDELLVGRRRDGTSLVHEARPTPATAAPASTQASNRALDEFHYGGDPKGTKCPLASHVRRVNPRDDIDATEWKRHRILRRGIPYANEKKKGVLFVCFNARIDTQFEFIQSEWCNKGDFLGHFTDVKDPIVGGGGGAFVCPELALPLRPVPRFVTVRGGDYFFVPGVEALHGLLQGKSVTPSVRAPAPRARRAMAMPFSRQPRMTPELVKEAAADVFDPVAAAVNFDAGDLLRDRQIARKDISWPGRQQAVYFVACQDHVRAILGNNERFTSDQYAKKIVQLLADYTFDSWLRAGDAPERGDLKRVLLGMPLNDPEKEQRTRLLLEAFGGGNAGDLGQSFGEIIRRIVGEVTAAAITAGKGSLDVATDIATHVPIAITMGYFGVPAPMGPGKNFSDTYIALYFERRSFDSVRDLHWLDKLPKYDPVHSPAVELAQLVETIGFFLLVDAYDTRETLESAKLAVAPLFDTLGRALLAEEDRIQLDPSSAPQTLLGGLLRIARKEADPARSRIRVGMILAELAVGSFLTTAKAITDVVDSLLSHPEAMACARKAIADRDSPLLRTIVLEAMRLQPVAQTIIRDCPRETTLQLSIGGRMSDYQFDAGSRIFLLMEAAMRDLPGVADPAAFLLDGSSATTPALAATRLLSFGDGGHLCFGREIVLAALCEVLTHLLPLEGLRRVPGSEGHLGSLRVRFEPKEEQPVATPTPSAPPS
jgi:Dyp-type peroxidase family